MLKKGSGICSTACQVEVPVTIVPRPSSLGLLAKGGAQLLGELKVYLSSAMRPCARRPTRSAPSSSPSLTFVARQRIKGLFISTWCGDEYSCHHRGCSGATASALQHRKQRQPLRLQRNCGLRRSVGGCKGHQRAAAEHCPPQRRQQRLWPSEAAARVAATTR